MTLSSERRTFRNIVFPPSSGLKHMLSKIETDSGRKPEPCWAYYLTLKTTTIYFAEIQRLFPIHTTLQHGLLYFSVTRGAAANCAHRFNCSFALAINMNRDLTDGAHFSNHFYHTRLKDTSLKSTRSAATAYHSITVVVIVFILCSDPVYCMSSFVFCFSELT
jgi:hypothetical protein